MRRIERLDALVLLLLVGGMLAVYSCALFIPYAYSDDYPWLWRVLAHSATVYPRLAAQGRPLNAVLLQRLFRQAGNLAALRYVRTISVIEITGMGWMFYLAALRGGVERVTAAILGGMACLVPAVQVYAAWTNAVPIPLACILAAVAAMMTGWAMDRWRGRWPAFILAPILLMVAASIYQPAVTVFLPLAAMDSYQEEGKLLKRLSVYAFVCCAGLFLGWCVFQYGLAHHPEWVRAERSGFALDARDKTFGFIRNPLIDSLNLFKLRSSPNLAVGMAAFLCIGLMCSFSGNLLRRLGCLALAAMFLPLSYVVNLLARGDSWSFRTQIGLEWMVLVLGWKALDGLWRTIRNRRPPPMLLGVIAAVCACQAACNVTALIAWPQSLEQSLLRIALSRSDAEAARRIILLQPTTADSPAAFSRYDEFGVPSLSEGWVPRAEVNLIRREIDHAAKPIDVEPHADFKGPWATQLPPGTVVIDMRSLR